MGQVNPTPDYDEQKKKKPERKDGHKPSIFYKLRNNYKYQKYIFIFSCLLLPLIFFIGIRILPTLFTFNVGFREWNLLSTGDRPFVGLSNFVTLFKDEVFLKSLLNTFIYIVIGVIGQLTIGIIVALLLHKIKRFVGLFRVIYFIPYVTSIVAISWVFQWLFMSNGFINDFLMNLGFSQQPFLNSPDQAIFVISAAMIWQSIGFQMVLFLAGLSNIPDMLYEASDIDGATPWQKFWHVTVPLLNPTIVFSSIIGMITFIQVSFTQVVNMSMDGSGGPLNSTISVVVYIYQQAFRQYDMGTASAATVILFLFIMSLTIFQMKVLTKKFDY
ncbi:carbohydrate ABC transporter permease [Oceanobacillus manasiensis]|uniref:carbohydrate ABC transporter permease n=1 Tax=Oceanobacillus manasiensis TaxID=586413 RepID=UPI000A0232CB|nr:sugar ABC transporter permease [Oceanobacillus manasiensis]